MCFTDMFECLPKYLEKTDFDTFLEPLLKRASESSAFLRDEAFNALRAMLNRASTNLCFVGLLAICNAGSRTQKATSIFFLDECIHLHGAKVIQSREYGNAVKTLGTLLGAPLPDTRQHARRSILHLAKMVPVHVQSYGAVSCRMV